MRVMAGRVGEHLGDVFVQLDPVVESLTSDHFESDIGVAVIDPVTAGTPGNNRKDTDPKAIHQTSIEKRPAQGEATQCAHRAGAVLLHGSNCLHRIPAY